MQNNSKNLSLSTQNYEANVMEMKSFFMQFVLFDKNSEIQFIKIISSILAKIDKLFLRDPLVTILKELITNAVKANSKRLYFKQQELSITDKSDYIKGMENFKEDFIESEKVTFEDLQSGGFRVRITFNLEKEFPVILVSNNIPIVDEEMAKINARITKAYKYDNITDAFSDVLDDSEGAGLGLIMALIVFKNSGFERSDFIAQQPPKVTTFGIRISQGSGNKEIVNKLTEEILSQIEYLPSLPENITRLTELCDQPEAAIIDIANYIKTDPGLATSILKKANSAGYLTSHRVSSIEDAVKKIGMKGIKSLAMLEGVENVIHDKYPRFKTLWLESYKKAYYANQIAVKQKKKALADTAYLAALISSIGEISLLAATETVSGKLRELARIKNIAQTDMFEEITLGISHSTLGAIITERWNFDSVLTSAIRYHTRPHLAPQDAVELAQIIYLAHIFSQAETRNIHFESLEYDALNDLTLTNEDDFWNLYREIKENFQSENS